MVAVPPTPLFGPNAPTADDLLHHTRRRRRLGLIQGSPRDVPDACLMQQTLFEGVARADMCRSMCFCLLSVMTAPQGSLIKRVFLRRRRTRRSNCGCILLLELSSITRFNVVLWVINRLDSLVQWLIEH